MGLWPYTHRLFSLPSPPPTHTHTRTRARTHTAAALTAAPSPLADIFSTDLCPKLRSADIHKATHVGGDAFYKTTQLERINMPKVEYLGHEVFYNIASLDISMPSVTNFKEAAFSASLLSANVVKVTPEKMSPEAKRNIANNFLLKFGVAQCCDDKTCIDWCER